MTNQLKSGFVDIETICAQLRPRRLTRREAWLAHLGILRQALSILDSKRRGYSGTEYAFNNFYSELLSGCLPEMGAWRRYLDKLARMAQLAYGGHIDDIGEPLTDVFRDRSNYDAIMSLLVLETMLNDDAMKDQAQEMLDELMKDGKVFSDLLLKEGVDGGG